MQIICFNDTPDCITAISDMLDRTIRVDYSSSFPVLKFAIGSIEHNLSVGDWIAMDDAGCIFILDEEMTREALQEFLAAHMEELHALPVTDLSAPDCETLFDFGAAIGCLKGGARVARKSWNGKGIYLEMQTPDEHSKMTLPYIYIVTNGLISDNPDAPRGAVPWLASQTDMLSEDWYVVE